MKEQQNKVVQPDTYCKQNRDGDGHWRHNKLDSGYN